MISPNSSFEGIIIREVDPQDYPLEEAASASSRSSTPDSDKRFFGLSPRWPVLTDLTWRSLSFTQSRNQQPPAPTQQQADMAATSSNEKPQPLDADSEDVLKWQKQARRKMDVTLVPLMCAITLLQYLDKAILSYAALLGLITDLKLISNEYSWAASIYYFGMLAGLPLWWATLQRFQPQTIVGSAVIIWGAVAMCHAACHDYSTILCARFFLGFFEAAVIPSFIIIIGQNYTKKQTIARTAIWYSFNGVALMIGGGMSYSLLQHASTAKGSLATWRELYLILGGVTIAVGILARWVVPMDPLRSRFYSDEQKKALKPMEEGRMAANAEKEAPFDWNRAMRQAGEAFCDPRLYIVFFGLTLGSIPNGGVTAYSLQLIAGFGFPKSQSLLLTLAPGGAQIVSVLTFIGVALLTRSRAIAGIILLVIAIVGAVVMYEPKVSEGAHMVGYTLLNFGSPAVVALYSFNSAAISGKGKRVVFAVIAQVAYAAGNIIGPLTFLAEETPVYRTAKIIIIATLCGAALSLALILGIHMHWNKKRDLEHEQRQRDLSQRPRLEDQTEDIIVNAPIVAAINAAKSPSDPRTAAEIIEDALKVWEASPTRDVEPEPRHIPLTEEGKLCESHSLRIWEQIKKGPKGLYEPTDFEDRDYRYVL